MGKRTRNENIKTDRFFLFVYITMLIIFAVMIILPCSMIKRSSFTDKFGEINIIDTGWVDKDGNSINLYNLDESTKTLSIYHDIPEELPNGTSLCFSSRNIYMDVYLNEEMVESIPIVKLPVYNKSPATVWHYIDIAPDMYGGKIKLKIDFVYDKDCSSINDICLANSTGFILNYIIKNHVAFVVCISMIFIGLCFMFIDLYAYAKLKKSLDVFFLGLFATLVAIWCTFETGVMHLFLEDTRIIQTLEMYILMLLPIPLVYYTRSYFEIKSNLIVYVTCGISAITFLFNTILNLTGIADLAETLTLTHFNIILSALFIVYKVVYRFIVNIKDHKHDSIMLYIGFVSIIVSGFVDMMRFYIGSGDTDAALFLRAGLFIFVLCYGSLGLQTIMEKAKLGIRSEFVHKLAYEDGLTGIGNRTAYMETALEYEKSKKTVVGIVILDVNNLKKINDKYGHNAGDDLIIKSAEIIQEAFEESNKCYRIGGDEFAVLIDGENIIQKYSQSIERFKKLIDKTNAESDYDISIAYGMAVYDSEKECSFSDVLGQADEQMYICKNNIKQTNAEKAVR